LFWISKNGEPDLVPGVFGEKEMPNDPDTAACRFCFLFSPLFIPFFSHLRRVWHGKGSVAFVMRKEKN